MNLPHFKVTKGNRLIEAKYSRGLIETRIVDACVAQIDSPNDLTPERFFEISAAQLVELHGMDAFSVHNQLKIAAKNLIDQQLMIPATNTWINWFSSVTVPPGESKIVLRFSVDIKPYLFALDGDFTSYPLKHTLQFQGSYSHRMYEFLMQWLPVGKKEFSLDELKHRMGLEGRYGRIDDFKRRVVDPAVEEINQHTNILAEYTQRKAGRTVTHLVFTFKLKESAGKKSPLKKLSMDEFVQQNPTLTKGKSAAEVEKLMGKR